MSAKVLKSVTVMVAAILAVPWSPARGQDVGSFNELELEYNSAKSSYEAALDARSAQVQRYETALARVTEARRNGDAAAVETAQARFYTESQELQLRDRRVSAVLERLDQARDAFLDVVDLRRDSLEAELAAATTPVEEGQVRADLRDLENRYMELETEPAGMLDPGPVFFASLLLDPRDGPLEWGYKADLLERKAGEAEVQLQELDEEVRRLEARDRLRRSGESFSAGLDRFGTTTLPTGVTRTSPPRPGDIMPDSTSAQGRLPLAQRVELLRADRLQLEALIEQLRRQANQLRELLGRLG